MDPHEAIHLIKDGLTSDTQPQIWLDLGCGKGTFTYALSSLLPSGSRIIAIDREDQPLNAGFNPTVPIIFKNADFETEDLEVGKVAGILMANSLHFIKDKLKLIRRINKLFIDRGRFIIIEYDTMQSNPWVPFPIDFINLKVLCSKLVVKTITKLGEQPSKYNNNNIYAASITF